MPRIGKQPNRRAALVKATIDSIGAAGTLDVTVAQIARRAGVSPALAHHYLGSKDDMFLAAMRHILTVYGAEVRGALTMAPSPRARAEAVIRASFSAANFRPAVVTAWLNFYVLARAQADAARLLSLYQARIRSNLRHALRPALGAGAADAAERLAGLIDGLYLRQVLRPGLPDGEAATQLVLTALDRELSAAGGAGP
jgi:TetR/AcrR family transcriptional repressor of bet genes